MFLGQILHERASDGLRRGRQIQAVNPEGDSLTVDEGGSSVDRCSSRCVSNKAWERMGVLSRRRDAACLRRERGWVERGLPDPSSCQAGGTVSCFDQRTVNRVKCHEYLGVFFFLEMLTAG